MEGAGGGVGAQLLAELAAGDVEQVLPLGRFSLGNGPGPLVLVSPEWAAGVDQQDFRRTVAEAVHQEAGAGAGHLGSVRGRLGIHWTVIPTELRSEGSRAGV